MEAPSPDDMRERRPAAQHNEGETRERRGVTFEIAQSKAELVEAFRLVHDSYVRVGLISPNESGLRASIYNALPETVTFLAKVRGRAISTLTLVPDSPVGIPMDEMYQEEVNALRAEGCKVGEVSMLCDRRQLTQETFRARILSVFVGLARLMINYATTKPRLTDLLIAVHPHHASFYAKHLLFKRFADDRPCPYVENKPAVPLRLDIRHVLNPSRPIPEEHRSYWPSQVPEQALSHNRLSPEALRCLFVEKTNVLQRAPRTHREYVLACYGLTEETAGLT